ncbi:ankyrin-3-like [Schistocerca nitens]|uniref:ankyrin-3-like n=1 Tax=Schistocerca nitens TaxID=7011 RepID=UPI002119B16D|nr:ankyrin-3-like [Schistocerca nitens]
MAATYKVETATATALGDLLDAGDSAMVTLEAGATRLVAHRAVVAARSSVFSAMLHDDTPEAGTGHVSIPNMEGPVLRQLVAYMYTLQIPQLPSMVSQLLAVADSYGVSKLKTECEQQLAAQLSVENAAATAVLAVRWSCPSLTAATLAFIKAHNFQVMATQGWADAMRTAPEDLIEVSCLLADSPTETSLPATVENRPTPTTAPHTDHSGTPVAAVSPTTTRHPTPHDDVTISHIWSLSGEDKGRRLIQAAQEGALEEVRALLAAGADVGARDGDKRTALHRAAWEGHVDVARSLVQAGAEVNARNIRQNMPLHSAAARGHTAMVQLLVAASADLNARGMGECTPLHFAADRGHPGAAAVLVDAGAEIWATNNWGYTPLELAQRNYDLLVDLLS